MKEILGLPMKWLARYYYTILVVWITLMMSSCGMMIKLSDEQLHQRSKIDYEMNKLYNEYQVKNDSLLIEYYKIK
jgi:hypothetical protein